MDYRFWIKDGDWEQFDEATLQEIDQAVEWGEQVRDPRLHQLSPRPGLHRGQAAGEDQSVDRPRDAARVRRALGHVRPPLPRHPQRTTQLQPDERAGGRRAGGLRGGGPQAGRRDPGRRSGAADHLRRPAVGHRFRCWSCASCGSRRPRAATRPARSATTRPAGSTASIFRCRSGRVCCRPTARC